MIGAIYQDSGELEPARSFIMSNILTDVNDLSFYDAKSAFQERIQMTGGHAGPDGLALDEEGGLVIAQPSTTAWRFDALGRPTHHVDCGDDIFCTNIAFAGRDLHLVVSRRSAKVVGGTILKATMPVAGKPMFSHS